MPARADGGAPPRLTVSSIATRHGDDGTTSLLYGQRVPKDHPQIEAVGAFDELNAAIGAAKAASPDPVRRAALERIQHDLVALMGEVACAEADTERHAASTFRRLGEEDLARLDEALAAPPRLGDQHRHLHRMCDGQAEGGQQREHGQRRCHAQAAGEESRQAGSHLRCHHPMRTPR